jgi:lipoprotein-releasing system permease protein
MYKILLCSRYLLTRYLALACIVSVMLGVATLIVVNSVMAGFSNKLKDRLHGLLSDVLVEARSMEGFPDPERHLQRIRESAIGDKIEAMTPTLEVFAMIQFRRPDNGEMLTRPVRLIGVEPEGRAAIGGFSECLVKQKNSPRPTFEHSAEVLERLIRENRPVRPFRPSHRLDEPPPPDPPPSTFKIPEGIIVGHAIAHFRYKDPETGEMREHPVLSLGDSVIVTTVSGQRMAPVFDRFAVCDYFRSEMSEYDSNYVFVPLQYLQRLRTMEDRVSSIQIRLKNPADAKVVVAELERLFPDFLYSVETWEQKQGPLLAAISIEKGILNVLLFLIVGVAGFGILAIFSMIVTEKTRDIGILKSLGASNAGVMSIFLGYGLLLGLSGAVLGTGLGLVFTHHINDIEQQLSRLSGHEVFDRSIYYFNEIPTHVDPWAVLLVNLGAIAIAVLFSVLPALRAATLHPVRALRFE